MVNDKQVEINSNTNSNGMLRYNMIITSGGFWDNAVAKLVEELCHNLEGQWFDFW
jgi:hypothetical protein